jgi:uncharacterized protein
MDYDVIIIGSGPAGLWAADTLKDSKLKIAIFEKGAYSSGGMMNDCKLNLTTEIGMELDELQISKEKAEKYIQDIDDKFLEFGADTTVHGTNETEIKKWVNRANRCGVKLIACRQRHVGTDMSKQLINNYKKVLEEHDIKFHLSTNVTEILNENKEFRVKTSNGEFTSKFLIVSPGRDGAYWFRNQADKLGIEHNWGAIDVGVRLELMSEIYDPITEILYDPKFKLETKHHNDKVRTFCTNRGGKVRIEPENGKGFKLINGDALKNFKTQNTNFAILNTINLTDPYADTLEMGRDIAMETLRLGGGKPIVQRMGDFLNGRRSKKSDFNYGEKGLTEPTLSIDEDVVPGDISLAYRGRIIDNLRDAFDILDRIVPGIKHPSTLIYAPEIKFYDTKYSTTPDLETNVPNLFIAGDGVGKSRGIVGAAMTGIIAAEGIKKKL